MRGDPGAAAMIATARISTAPMIKVGCLRAQRQRGGTNAVLLLGGAFWTTDGTEFIAFGSISMTEAQKGGAGRWVRPLRGEGA